MLENPIEAAVLLCFSIGVVGSGLVRLGPLLGSPVAALGFLASYVLSYAQVPPFPPVGAVSKMFYIMLAPTLAGLVLDVLPGVDSLKKAVLVLAPLLSVVWIAFPR